jgi:hypothetical protein
METRHLKAALKLNSAATCSARPASPHLEAGGTLENARAMAARSPRTTKLHDRTGGEITLDEVERITI